MRIQSRTAKLLAMLARYEEYSDDTLDASEVLFRVLLTSLTFINTFAYSATCVQTYLGRFSNPLANDFPFIGFVLSDRLAQCYRLPQFVSQRPAKRSRH